MLLVAAQNIKCRHVGFTVLGWVSVSLARSTTALRKGTCFVEAGSLFVCLPASRTLLLGVDPQEVFLDLPLCDLVKRLSVCKGLVDDGIHLSADFLAKLAHQLLQVDLGHLDLF